MTLSLNAGMWELSDLDFQVSHRRVISTGYHGQVLA